MNGNRKGMRFDAGWTISSPVPDGERRRARGAAPARVLLTVLLAAGLWTDAACGQAQNDPLKVQRGAQLPAQAPPVIQQQQRPFYVQAAVVALLTGGAVWTVCRGSRRQ